MCRTEDKQANLEPAVTFQGPKGMLSRVIRFRRDSLNEARKRVELPCWLEKEWERMLTHPLRKWQEARGDRNNLICPNFRGQIVSFT